MKFNRLLAASAILFHVLTAQAQKEGNIWHFGNGAALDFNSGTAVVTTPSSMITFEGSASIADADGKLLFYTNGGGRIPALSGQNSGQIWNRNHEVMYDMNGREGGGFSSAQSAVIVPKPGSPGRYLLFTMEEIEFYVGGSVPGQPLGRGLSYFEVDMGLNGGLGGVAQYTESVYVPSYEGLCAIRHANGTDYWIVVHQSSGLGFAVFAVNATGIGTPQLFSVASGTSGVIKGSPDGTWVSSTSGPNGIVCRFDPATGILSNPLILSSTVSFMEFSPNSKRLYVLSGENSIQYVDLTSPNINASLTTVAPLQAFGTVNGQMQLAPDGKIYFVQGSFLKDSVFLSAIVCPNTAPFLELEKIGYSSANDQTFFGLPNFDNAIFRRNVDPPLPVDLGEDKTLCSNQSTVLDAGVSNAAYLWSNGAQTQTLQVSTSGWYAVTVTAAGCGVGTDSVQVRQVSLGLNAGLDTVICENEGFQLTASGNGNLMWTPENAVSNPDVLRPQFLGKMTTTLVLTATLDGCTEVDSMIVTVVPNPVVGITPQDTTVKFGMSVQLAGSGTGVFEWSPAEGLSCTDCPNPVATPAQTTTYLLTVINAEGCAATDSIVVRRPDCMAAVPNAFTPNGDQVNDTFRPAADYDQMQLRIYSRWGELVYSDIQPWDGRQEDQESPTDVYVYTISLNICGTTKQYTGHVTLLR